MQIWIPYFWGAAQDPAFLTRPWVMGGCQPRGTRQTTRIWYTPVVGFGATHFPTSPFPHLGSRTIEKAFPVPFVRQVFTAATLPPTAHPLFTSLELWSVGHSSISPLPSLTLSSSLLSLPHYIEKSWFPPIFSRFPRDT